jgi:hypothetical protein
MTAPDGGWVLFPKYPDRVDGRAVEPRPEEIYRVIQELPQHPRDLWGDE